MTQSRDTRIEQARAWGRSDAWILTHIGGTTADITRAIERMDAADRGDNAAWRAACGPGSGPADPDDLAELVDAICPPLNRDRKGRVVRPNARSMRDTGERKAAPAGNRGLTTVPELAETRLV